MNKILFFVSINISCLVVSHAQSKMITGKVIIDDKVFGQDVLDGILVQNLQTDAKTITNADGIFSINISVGDELLFKHDFYQERSVKISEAMLNRGFVTIHLNIEVIELGEANVNRLKKYFKDNISKEESQTEKINKSLGIDEDFKMDVIKAFYVANYLRSLGVNPRYENVIQLLDQYNVSALSHKKNLKIKTVNKYDQIYYLKDYFTENYFIEKLNIKKGTITNFLDYCYTKYDFKKLLKENKYDEILLVIEEQAPIYLNKINTNIIKND